MFDNGLDIWDENGLEDKKAVQAVYDEVEKCLENNQRLYDYLDSLQKLAGEDAIVQYKIFKGTDREEWLTWHGKQWQQQQRKQQDNTHKPECNKIVKTQHRAEQAQFNF